MTVIGHNRIRKVESFDGFEILAHPLPRREDRVFERGAAGPGVTYASHDVMIARPTGIGGKDRVAILMHHGGGRHVLIFYETALPIISTLLELPERAQYAMAYAIFEQADECSAGSRADEAQRWATAFVDGRIRKTGRGRTRRIHVETPSEKEYRRSRSGRG
jgi:hypothetical protein